MDLSQSDACDGRAQQSTSIALIILGAIFLFFIMREMSILFCWIAFGPGIVNLIMDWIDPFIIFVTGIIFASTHQNFWVNVEGNKIQPAIDIFFPAKLRDGSTRFIVFTSGFAFKLPWIITEGDPIDIEKRRTESCKDDFTVTVGGTSLVMNFKIAWKPHLHFLSTYLQNATTSEGNNDILDQIIAQTKQLIEEESARLGELEDPNNPGQKGGSEKVRTNQSLIIQNISPEIEKFAEWFGINVLKISFSKCDYSSEVQATMDAQKQSEFIAQITEHLIRSGVEPGEAGRLAAVQAGVKNISITDQNFGGLKDIAKIVTETLLKWKGNSNS